MAEDDVALCIIILVVIVVTPTSPLAALTKSELPPVSFTLCEIAAEED